MFRFTRSQSMSLPPDFDLSRAQGSRQCLASMIFDVASPVRDDIYAMNIASMLPAGELRAVIR